MIFWGEMDRSGGLRRGTICLLSMEMAEHRQNGLQLEIVAAVQSMRGL